MLKTFGVDKYKFYLSDITTSIIYNNESIKNKIINELIKEDYMVISSKTLGLNISVKDFLTRLNFNMKLIPYFDLKEMLNKKLMHLCFEDQIFITIISMLSDYKGKVVFDDVLTFLSSNRKYLVLKYIKDNNIIFYNFTSDIEEVLFTKYLIVLSSDGVLIEGNTKSVLNEEKIIKHNGFSLPFVVDLSSQLRDYGILDKEYYSIDRLVSDLWK